MSIEAYRIQNFMGFADTGWIRLRPITMLFGRNSVGKSAILRSLLLLHQSVNAGSETLLFYDDAGKDLGRFEELVRNHDPESRMTFGFQFRPGGTSGEANGASGSQGGDQWAYQVGRIIQHYKLDSSLLTVLLTYALVPNSTKTVLVSVELRDSSDDRILVAQADSAELDARKPWHFESDFFKFDPEAPENIRFSFARLRTSTGFWPVFERTIDTDVSDESSETDHSNSDYSKVQLLLQAFQQSVTEFFRNLAYVGPFRGEPQRFYYTAGRTRGLGTTASDFGRELLVVDESQLAAIQQWLSSSRLAIKLDFQALDKYKTLYELRLVDIDATSVDLRVNVREAGFGISQVLPIVTKVFSAPGDATMLIEQPELHLHPSAQAELGDLLIARAGSGNGTTFVETHSEHILLRIRRRIAETSAGKAPTNQTIRSDSLAVYFVDRVAGESYLQQVNFDAYGDYRNPPAGFKDFFTDDLEEVMALRRAVRAAAAGGGPS